MARMIARVALLAMIAMMAIGGATATFTEVDAWEVDGEMALVESEAEAPVIPIVDGTGSLSMAPKADLKVFKVKPTIIEGLVADAPKQAAAPVAAPAAAAKSLLETEQESEVEADQQAETETDAEAETETEGADEHALLEAEAETEAEVEAPVIPIVDGTGSLGGAPKVDLKVFKVKPTIIEGLVPDAPKKQAAAPAVPAATATPPAAAAPAIAAPTSLLESGSAPAVQRVDAGAANAAGNSVVRIGGADVHIHVTQKSMPIPNADALRAVENKVDALHSSAMGEINGLIANIEQHRTAKKPCLKKLKKTIRKFKAAFVAQAGEVAKIEKKHSYADDAPTLAM